MVKATLSVMAVLAMPGSAMAQVDGSYKAAYGSPIVVQNIGTGFGDSNLGQINYANGSELDMAFGYGAGGNLNLLLTGNLEGGNGNNTYNKLMIFIDNGDAGGYNVLPNGMPQFPGNYAGMTLDQNGVNGATQTFRATHWISVTAGGPPFGMFVDGGNFLNSTGQYLGGNDGQSLGVLGGGTNILNAAVALNNSNVLGVNGSAGTGQGANAFGALTGVEVQIPFAALGLGSLDGVKVMAFINGGSHDYLANQFLGYSSLPVGTGNLGNDGAGTYTNGQLGLINMNASTYGVGDQWFYVPAPSPIALLGMGGILAARRRRA